jgi:hypothetical protein
MIKASSLFYAIVISIIIAIVSSSLILFAYLNRIAFDNLQTQQRLNLNADSGLTLLMSRQSLIELNQPKTIDLYGSGEDSVFLSRRSWGAFEILISKAIFHNQEVERIAEVGCPMDSTNLYSIYLADEGKPLALCGNTKIKGTAYLPKSGVERAYIEGQNFMGKVMIEGPTKISKNELPEFNPELIQHIQRLFKEKKVGDRDSTLRIERSFSGDSIYNSFKNVPLILSATGPIKIQNGSYSGNVAIISDTIITVAATAGLTDIILAAPKIIFEEHFKGNLQVFASDSIIVNENVSFHYPSVLGIVAATPEKKCAIVLNDNDSLAGNIFAYQVTIDSYKRSGICIGNKSVVTGQVYSSGYVEIKGTLFGSVMCSKFMLVTPSSVYENHLLNVVIDQPALPKYFTGINSVQGVHAKKIVKWLN